MKKNELEELDQLEQFLTAHCSKIADEPVPENLGFKVEAAIEKGKQQTRKSKRASLFLKFATLSIASFVMMLNISPTFAKAMHEIPVAGELFKLFTFNEFHYEDDLKLVDVRIPEFSYVGKSELEKKVNDEISYFVDRELESSMQNASDYCDAVIATGGSMEDCHQVTIIIDYEVHHMDENLLSFSISKFEGAFSAYDVIKYYNLDMNTERYITLKDYLGDDYVDIVMDEIEKDIATWDDEQKLYLFEEIDIRSLINEQRSFYINEKGNPVVVFAKYEIAAGAAGQIEFEIPIDKK